MEIQRNWQQRIHKKQNKEKQNKNTMQYVLGISDLRHVVVFSINKTDHHDITKLLLKMALNTITLTHEQ